MIGHFDTHGGGTTVENKGKLILTHRGLYIYLYIYIYLKKLNR